MSKHELIQAICSINQTATESFLNQFKEQELEQYLSHLQYTAKPRPARELWPRPAAVSA